MQKFLDLARQGKNEWWRYVLAILLILFMWQILGALPSAAFFIWVFLSGGTKSRDLPVNPATLYSAGGFVVFMLASVFFIGGIYLALRFIHRRSFRTLVTPARSIAWGRLFQGFGLWFLLAALMSGVEALLFPGRYVLSLDLKRFLPFVILALIFIPIQTSTEELFFRGYILQGVGLRLRSANTPPAASPATDKRAIAVQVPRPGLLMALASRPGSRALSGRSTPRGGFRRAASSCRCSGS